MSYEAGTGEEAEVPRVIVVGTDDGVRAVQDDSAQHLGLAGKRVTHVAARRGVTVATVPHDGLYQVDGDERQLWEGDARSCAVAPDGALYVGTEPAMIYRSDDGGDAWQRCSAIDDLPTRSAWTFPPPPHEPHVRSIDFLPRDGDSVLAGIEVGGVILSRDRGETWREMNEGVYVDVHAVRRTSRGRRGCSPAPGQGSTLQRTTVPPGTGDGRALAGATRSASASIRRDRANSW